MPLTTFPIATLPATASLIANVPSGTVSSTNVQDAINELAVGVPENDGIFNVLDYGAVGDNVADDAPAIQAAIDAACAAGRGAIYIPPGQYKCYSRPIFLDPPGNMRGADGTNGNAWAPGPTYGLNSTVNRLGIPYISILTPGNTNKPPESEPTFWRPFNWNAGTAYLTGNIVRHGGVPWIALQNTTGNDPMQFNSLFWKNHFLDPQNFAFTLRLFGALGGSHEIGFSSRLNTNDANIDRTGIFVGPGQGMQVDHLSIFKADPNITRRAKKGWGVAIAGGGGGNTRTTIEHCLIENFEVGVITGFNQDSLGDSNLLYRCAVWGCYIGFQISQTQNFINNVIECSFSNTIGIRAVNGQTYNVFGGNFSRDAYSRILNISGAGVVSSGLNPVTDTVTATVSNGDQILADLAYERFAINTARWGIIPLNFVSWTPTGGVPSAGTGTGTLVLTIDDNWKSAVWGENTNVQGIASWAADIAAATTLYANEWLRVFIGPAKVKGVHIENHNDAHTLLLLQLFFANSHTASLEDIYYNNDIDGSGSSNPWFFVQTVTPWILANTNGAMIWVRNVGQGAGAGRRFVNIWEGRPNNSIDVRLEQCNTLRPIILRGSSNAAFRVQSDMDLWLNGTPSTEESDWVRFGEGTTRFLNNAPHPAEAPLITETHLTAWVNNTAYNQGNFPPMYGEGRTYKLLSDTTKADIVNIRSNHRFYTYGGTVILTNAASPTRNWAYKGGSKYLYVDSGDNIRAGLTVTLNNGTDPVFQVYIKAGWDIGGALPLMYLVDAIGVGPLIGVAGTEFTGTTLGTLPPNVTYEVVGETRFEDGTADITLTNRQTSLIIDAAGVIAARTITMCNNPRDRQKVEIRTDNTITALTISPGSGQAVAAPPTTLAAGGLISAIYRASNTTWYF